MLLCLHASLFGFAYVLFVQIEMKHIEHRFSVAVHQQCMTVHASTQVTHTHMISGHRWFLHIPSRS